MHFNPLKKKEKIDHLISNLICVHHYYLEVQNIIMYIMQKILNHSNIRLIWEISKLSFRI
jgi:hypothetical protein